MTPADTIFSMLQADIQSGKATKRSLGAFYAMALGFIPADATERWHPFNDAIRISCGGDIRYLEHVKLIGWAIYDAVVAAKRAA